MSNTDANGKERIDYKDPDTLRRLYWGEELSTVDIAERARVWPSTVSDWMERHGIERRDRIDAVKNKRSKRPATFSMTGEGYLTWQVQHDNERESIRACRLLAVAEYGFEAVKGMHVHHKNGIPWLDYADNIELLEPSEHLRSHTQGDNNPQAKLTEDDVERVRQLARESKLSQREIAEQFGISQGHVSDLKNGNRR